MVAATVRPSPCQSCPYRRDAPSGVWAADEYDLLPQYDKDTTGQAMAEATRPFFCHQADDHVCAGWAGCHDMTQTLAARIGVISGTIAASIYTYATKVPLFASGAEAAEHGKRDIRNPGEAALAALAKIIKVRAARGDPVTGYTDADD